MSSTIGFQNINDASHSGKLAGIIHNTSSEGTPRKRPLDVS